MLRAGSERTYYSGNSMWPTFRPGDRLVLEECGAAALVPGEVVVFRGTKGAANARVASGGSEADARLVCHRVLRVAQRDSRTWVLTQGDCTRKPDPEWPGDRLVGRVVEVLPVRGRPRKLSPAPLLGWRLRHRLSLRRVARGLHRRAAYAARRIVVSRRPLQR